MPAHTLITFAISTISFSAFSPNPALAPECTESTTVTSKEREMNTEIMSLKSRVSSLRDGMAKEEVNVALWLACALSRASATRYEPLDKPPDNCLLSALAVSRVSSCVPSCRARLPSVGGRLPSDGPRLRLRLAQGEPCCRKASLSRCSLALLSISLLTQKGKANNKTFDKLKKKQADLVSKAEPSLLSMHRKCKVRAFERKACTCKCNRLPRLTQARADSRTYSFSPFSSFPSINAIRAKRIHSGTSRRRWRDCIALVSSRNAQPAT